MTRYTLEAVREKIAILRDKENVYKVEVDAVKHDFNHAFEAGEKVLKDKWLSIPHDQRSEWDGKLYYESPYEVRHWYGKKFSAFLIECPDSEYKDGVVSHRNRWKPLFDALQELIARQVKGRVPVEKIVIGTRIQLRATCACCFRDHAVSGDRMVAHGYTLEYGFHNGPCYGAGKAHFGTEEGLQFTMGLIVNVLNAAARARRNAEGAENGEVKPIDRKTGKRIDNPTEKEVLILIADLTIEARQAEHHAKMMQFKVDRWKLEDPREVEVEITE